MISKKGFTLIEVVITLSLLVGMVYAVSQLMKASIDIKLGIKDEVVVTHRLNMALERMASDIGHAYIVTSKDLLRSGGKKKTIFKIEKTGSSDTISFTYMGHRPVKASSKEGDTSYVVYEVQESKSNPGRKNLMRGEFPRVPDDFKVKPPMQILCENIESIKTDPWKGDDWSNSRWDTTNSDEENRLPHMVRIIVRTWADPPAEGEQRSEHEDRIVQIATVAYLPNALDFNELKQRLSSFRIQ